MDEKTTNEKQERGASLVRWAEASQKARDQLSEALWALAIEANAAGQLDRERVFTHAASALRTPEVWPLVEATNR